jgi:hypothetical protein
MDALHRNKPRRALHVPHAYITLDIDIKLFFAFATHVDQICVRESIRMTQKTPLGQVIKIANQREFDSFVNPGYWLY